MKKYLIAFFIVVVVIVVALYYKSSLVSAIDSFEACAKAGNPILESYPRQCRTSDGRSFVEEIVVGHSLIKVTSPKSGDTISSPLVVTGEARGTWFFEASFPVRLLDAEGKEIAVIPAQAQGEWMTEEFMPFKAVLEFENTSGAGTLVLHKDNPSGLPQFEDSFSIPVVFSQFSQEVSSCKPTGCSGQICSDKDVATTCEFRPEYACYKKARCEKQLNGKCDWTETEEFKSCLNVPVLE